jgi:choline dehydrogenase-like flavoprotein
MVRGYTLTTQTFDVCVVGSGAAGGFVAKELCEGGAKVIMLEGGKEVRPTQIFSHQWPYELPYRNFRSERQAYFYQGDVRSSIRYDTRAHVNVDRARVLGGRTMHWNAVTLRYAPPDFREWSLAGVEDDWPLTYEELAPYYERVEQIIGVCGNDDGLEIVPGGKHYLPPLPWRCSEHILKRATDAANVPLIPVRKALLTKPYDNRPPCHYCGHCMDGCDVSAIFSSPGCTLPKAAATGNFTLRQNALAREILVDREGLARAVSFVDTTTGKAEEVKARIVVLCCATVESARLLLNSVSPRHPGGLGNSSGVVGHYLHGHIGGGARVYLKELEGTKPINQDGATDHVYIPRFDYRDADRGYAGGYGFQVNFDSYMFPRQALSLKGYGPEFKRRVRTMQPGYVMFGGFGKSMAARQNYVSVDKNQVDAHGIPVPVVRFQFVENDVILWKAMRKGLERIVSGLSADVFFDEAPAPSGFASHEVGTVRMGKDPKKSALNGFCQSHDVKNLFVTDGSSFTTSSEKNPTLTIMALSMRAAEYIIQQRKLGSI